MIWLIAFLIWVSGATVALYLLEEDTYRWLRDCGYEGERLFRAFRAFPMTNLFLSLFSWYMVVSVIRERTEQKRLDGTIKEIIRRQAPAIIRYMKEKEGRND